MVEERMIKTSRLREVLIIPSGRRGVARLKHGESFVLQNHEAPLRDFGLNKHFPIVGKRLLSRSFLIILGRKLLRAGADYLPHPLPKVNRSVKTDNRQKPPFIWYNNSTKSRGLLYVKLILTCIFKFPETSTLWEGSAFLAEGEV